MALIRLPSKDYEVMASILKDGAGMRCSFTFKELLSTFENVGFTFKSRGRLTYEGKLLFIFKPGDKSGAAVSYARQDELKQQLFSLFGWTKGTFGEH